MRLVRNLLVLIIFINLGIGVGKVGAEVTDVIGFNCVANATGVWQQTESQVIHGEILEVHSAIGKIRVLSEGRVLILALSENCQLLRNNLEVSINSLRPIQDGIYQEGLFVQDATGLVTHGSIHFHVEEKWDEAHGSTLIFYDIFGNVKEIQHL